MNALQEHYAEVLLNRIRNDPHPSNTHMNMLEAVAGPRQLAAYALHLMERIEGEAHPSIPMMRRLERVAARFGG
jgi:hypothetical protein